MAVLAKTLVNSCNLPTVSGIQSLFVASQPSEGQKDIQCAWSNDGLSLEKKILISFV